ncbi:MAG: hypothetical protein H6633_30405 [Anaerolineales bacterium]|nr:hypothetical protein [Anaerolineales bacterium]
MYLPSEGDASVEPPIDPFIKTYVLSVNGLTDLLALDNNGTVLALERAFSGGNHAQFKTLPTGDRSGAFFLRSIADLGKIPFGSHFGSLFETFLVR